MLVESPLINQNRLERLIIEIINKEKTYKKIYANECRDVFPNYHMYRHH